MHMEKGAIERFEQAADLLPMRWRWLARQLPDWQKAVGEELRLRGGCPMTVLLPEGERMVSSDGSVVTQSDLEQLCDTVTGYSRYAAVDTISAGYLTAPGGFRVGICGTAVIRDGQTVNLKDISSAVIRVGRERRGIAQSLLPQLWDSGHFCSTLILSPPGLGKTTLLRDLIRLLSDGSPDMPACRVSVVDERSEIAMMYHGVAQAAIGCHTDVLDACPKALGIPILLRAANPQIIAVDEVTVLQDVQAMEGAANCGVALLATVHAASLEELREKTLFRRLLKSRVFSRCIVIGKDGDTRTYTVEQL